MPRTFMPFRNGGNITPLEDLAREVDSLVQNIFDPEDRSLRFTPAANLAETESEYELTLDLPGVEPDDVSVELNDGKLVVSGVRHSVAEQEGKTFHRVERRHGQFRRVVTIPAPVDEDQIDAECSNGVLTVRLPKCTKAKTRKITIKRAE